ncbi:hypothetical protein PG996_012868 [Apiospora saccharicola]|uniref:Secreted protein n=1 Tax=Apiospora saccharicola TaxID=335842 RepID=A0ABR1U3U8_9PEZI
MRTGWFRRGILGDGGVLLWITSLNATESRDPLEVQQFAHVEVGEDGIEQLERREHGPNRHRTIR